MGLCFVKEKHSEPYNSKIFQDISQLKYACETGNLKSIYCLIKQGMNINSHKNWAFKIACYNGHLNVMEYLVSVNANIYSNDEYVFTMAVILNNVKVVKFLLEKGTFSYFTWALSHAKNSGFLDLQKCLEQYQH